MSGVPVLILSHRKREFIERTVAEIKDKVNGIGDIYIIDDSGDPDHHKWLDDTGFNFSVVHPTKNYGYLRAMSFMFYKARDLSGYYEGSHVLFWEEDFIPVKHFNVEDLATVLDAHPELAQLNLQRQPVYRVERMFGYLESHQRRGYGLKPRTTDGVPWVQRRTPFTTNPGLMNKKIFDVSWPGRAEADRVKGGAEPAMSHRLEAAGYHFGWYGRWNQKFIHHVGTVQKTGTGY